MDADREREMSLTYGHSTSEWEMARTWSLQRLQRAARKQETVPYSALAHELEEAGHISLEPHGSGMAGLLGQMSTLEHEAGRPLISAVVVYKGGDLQPGPGFWDLAVSLGIKLGSGKYAQLEFWSDQLQACFQYWSAH